MDVTRLREALDDIFDQALVFHAFTNYMRDYELIVYCQAGSGTGIPPAHLRYLFKHCVHTDVATTVRADVWRQSLDDRLTDYDTGVDLDGYVWGVKWQELYPGATIIEDSPRAQTWRDQVGIDFHEVRIETNAHAITLVFSDLEVTEIPVGHSPFTVRSP